MPGDWAGASRRASSSSSTSTARQPQAQQDRALQARRPGIAPARRWLSPTAMRSKDGEVGGWTHAGQPTQDTRIPDSVIRIMRHKGKIGQDIDHPAVFPVALPEFVIEAYTRRGRHRVRALRRHRHDDAGRPADRPRGAAPWRSRPSTWTSPIKRFQQNFPDVPVTLVATGQTFDAVAAGTAAPRRPRHDAPPGWPTRSSSGRRPSCCPTPATPAPTRTRRWRRSPPRSPSSASPIRSWPAAMA